VALIEKAGITALIYTSPSYTPEKPRWRVVCPFSQELKPAQRRIMLARVNGVLGGVFAGESFTLSQSYYFGSLDTEEAKANHRDHITRGRYIDQMPELDAAAIGKDQRRTKGNSNGVAVEKADLEELTRRIVSGESLHPSVTQIAGKFARRSVPIDGATTLISAAIETANTPRYAGRWDEDVERAITDIYAAEARKREVPDGNGAASSTTNDDAELERLVRLPLLEYGRELKNTAKRLGIRVDILEAAVKNKRRDLGLDKDDGMQGRAVEYEEPKPWDDAVDLSDLLDDLAKEARRFVVFPKHGDVIAALWVAHTYVLDAIDFTPRLGVRAADKECGKTTLLEFLEQVIYRPDLAANITLAAFFRTVDQAHPGLLIDEVDSFVTEDSEILNVLNSGHSRHGRVKRVVGDKHEVRTFSTYAAVAYAHIGDLPQRFATLLSRSITIELRRRLPHEKVESLPKARRQRSGDFKNLRRKLKSFANAHATALTDAEPEVASDFVNRIADNWRPLLAIADLAGDEWSARARAAIGKTELANSEREMLLTDIRDIYARVSLKDDFISSTSLVNELHQIEGRPWATYGRSGKPISAYKVSSLLKPDVHPRKNTAGDARGYHKADFGDAFTRYLGPISPPPGGAPLQGVQGVRNPDGMGGSGLFQGVQNGSDSDTLKTAGNADGTSVSDTLTPCRGGRRESGGISPCQGAQGGPMCAKTSYNHATQPTLCRRRRSLY
jgi:Protein of unknown function (DUF3631)